ncbi:hypothetical protein HDU96_006932 [Phlyctochytrium bullatum]|nr:hypothetical protein HDU96_006932 [Phlyctochytrium bullatum]
MELISRLLAFTALLLAIALQATAQSADQCNHLVTQFTTASAGTRFISRSEFPWSSVRVPLAATAAFPTPQSFASLVRIPSVRTPEVISDTSAINTFINNRIQYQQPRQNAVLAMTIRSRFTIAAASLRIYRLYETNTRVHVFLVGRATNLAGCGLVGVRTVSVET